MFCAAQVKRQVLARVPMAGAVFLSTDCPCVCTEPVLANVGFHKKNRNDIVNIWDVFFRFAELLRFNYSAWEYWCGAAAGGAGGWSREESCVQTLELDGCGKRLRFPPDLMAHLCVGPEPVLATCVFEDEN